jgi:MOSC domain-containing protein YiiM
MTIAQEQGFIHSVHLGQVRPLKVGERVIRSAIAKQAVSGFVQVATLGLQGDEQEDFSVHGGVRKAVYALPAQHLAWWSRQRQQAGATLFDDPVLPGQLGENLSLQGVEEQSVFIGDELHFEGGVVLRVTEPRQPCSKFNAVMGYERAGKDMVQSGRCGFYLAVLTPGRLTAGERFNLRDGPHETSIAAALQHKARKHMR